MRSSAWAAAAAARRASSLLDMETWDAKAGAASVSEDAGSDALFSEGVGAGASKREAVGTVDSGTAVGALASAGDGVDVAVGAVRSGSSEPSTEA